MRTSNHLGSLTTSTGNRPAPANGRRSRKPYLLFLLFAALLTGQGKFCQAQLQWDFNSYDEFNGTLNSAPDSTKWVFETGTGNSFDAGEAETYCAFASNTSPCSSSQLNAYLDGSGHLVIAAYATSQTVTLSGITSPVYTSARINAINDAAHRFAYGRIEARVQIPKGQGAWPAFWQLGSDYNHASTNPGAVSWPESGEIDILESWGADPSSTNPSNGYTMLTQSQGSVHGPVSPGSSSSYFDQGATFTSPTELGDKFHTYAVEWGPGEVDFFVDGAFYGRRSPALLSTNELWEEDTTPFYALLNLAVGSSNKGYPDPPTVTPTTLNMVVDYVRYYTPSVSRTLPPGYGNYDVGGPGPNSAASYSGGTFTVTGSGNGIDLSTQTSSTQPNDQFQFVYKPTSADGNYIVNIASQSSTLSTAGAGIMIRDGRASYAQFALVYRAQNGNVHFQSRIAGQTVSDTSYGSCGPWLKLSKSGSSFSGYCSSDGSTWSTVGAVSSLTMNADLLAGLIATSGGNSATNTVAFTNLAVPVGRAAWDGNPPVIPTLAYKGVVPATLIQAENFDVGGQGTAYNTTLTSNTSGQYRPNENISIDMTSDYTTPNATVSGYMVDYAVQGQWMNYTVNVATPGTYTISTRVASNGTGGTFHFNLDGTQVSSEMTIPNTGGWDTWQTVSSSITFPSAGIHTIGLAMDTVGSATQYVGNFDLFTIQ